ncbi:diguanylate cyclase [Alteromonas sp. ASW11-36]|uniref:diguanylate cyclase n=1 Tax=Alteromonas arenosi TaxID=3055817 RepID=A0ABT7SWF2_9ALTE|nr:diguanylate cyclase [Alteromonas sp. ASW11-36]MDM7860517.1 diguanylate cyclase [Alteromonas sp. ASW11-36]
MAVAVLELAQSASASSQVESQLIVPTHMRHFSVAEGLSQVTVSDILQDRLGFMWFSTQNGLNRFDGYEFVQYRKDKTQDGLGPIGEFAYKLALDNITHDIWVATSGGLSRYLYESDSFRHYTLIGTDGQQRFIISTITVDRLGDIWAGSRYGMFKYNRQGDQFLPVSIDINETTRVIDIVRLTEATLLVATTNGLWRIDLENGQNSRLLIENDEITDIEWLGDSRLWVSTIESGIFEVSLAQQVMIKALPLDTPRLSNSGFTAINQLKNGDVWLSSYAGLAIVRPDDLASVRVLSFDNDAVSVLSSAHMTRTFEAESGLVWQGSWISGVSVFDPSSVNIKELNAEPFTTVRGLTLDDSDAIWFGTPNGVWQRDVSGNLQGPWLLNDESQSDGQSNSKVIRAIAFDQARQKFWVGTTGGLYSLLQPVSHLSQEPVLNDETIFHLTMDSNNDLWVGTFNDGLYYLDGDTLVTKNHWPLATVTHINTDDNQYTYAGSIEGLVRIDAITGEMINLHTLSDNPKENSPRVVTWVSSASDGHYWLGSQGAGVYKMQVTGQRYIYTQLVPTEHLANLSIGGVQEDRKGNLWASTTEGIAKINRNYTDVSYYNEKNGAKSEGYYINHSVMKSDGEILFGGPKGISSFYPEHVKRSGWNPNIILTNLSVLNNTVRPSPASDQQSKLTAPIHIANQIELGPQDLVFSVSFSALAFSSPENNLYSYRLEGFDADWISTSANNRTATYTNLDPGRYRLVVKGTNSDGIWSNKQATLLVIVHPPWYWTAWAQLLWAFLAIGLTVAIYHWRTSALKQRSRNLQQLVEARTRELEASNKKLQRLSTIDELTGLRNRRDFRQRAQVELERHKRTSIPFSILMLDIDYFKQINDQQGHACGDKVLRECATKMQSIIRESDLLARWGGEEFIILAVDTELDDAVILAEKIRKEIHRHTIYYNDQIITVSFTIGVAQIAPGQSLDECINTADKRMYAGKVRGKNQTHSSTNAY